MLTDADRKRLDAIVLDRNSPRACLACADRASRRRGSASVLNAIPTDLGIREQHHKELRRMIRSDPKRAMLIIDGITDVGQDELPPSGSIGSADS